MLIPAGKDLKLTTSRSGFLQIKTQNGKPLLSFQAGISY